MFPSVLGHAREIKFQQEDIAERHPGDHLKDDDGVWFVGDLALAQLPQGEVLRLRGRTANEATMGNAFRLRLAKVAIGKLVAGMWNRDVLHIRIATGLPVDHMHDAAGLKETLLGQHVIRTDTAELVANVCEVMVMPQGYGSILFHEPDESGEINRQHVYRRTGVCDISTYTVDLALDDEGGYGRRGRSVERCLHGARNASLPYWSAITVRKMPPRSSGCSHRDLSRQRNPVDYHDVVEEGAGAALRSPTVNLMGEKWRGGSQA
ncbi:MAG: hypothetical protein IPK19_37795 [Chloroflexi bacterium]|nr:hypothetical protein [Chloroflexota bacterium]